jgi:hypothetical protein
VRPFAVSNEGQPAKTAAELMAQGCRSKARRAMRFILSLLLGAVVCLLRSDKASALTPGELLESCDAVTKVAPPADGDTLDIPAAGLPCWYYMSAVQNMSALVNDGDVRLLGFCPPPIAR